MNDNDETKEELIEDETLKKDAMLQESEERFRNIFERTIYGILVADVETLKFIEANTTICAMLGYSHDEILGIGVRDIHPKKDLSKVISSFERQVRGEISLASDIPVLRKDGTVFHADIDSANINLRGKQCLIGVFRDITGLKKAEDALRLQSEIAENIAEGIYLVSSSDLKIVYANRKMEEIFRYGPGELTGKHVSIINAPTGGDPVQTAVSIEQSLRDTGAWRGEVLNIRKDGTTFWGHATISKMHDLHYGDVYLSLQTDVSERKQAEEKIHQSEQFIRSILDTVDEGFIVVDRDFRILTANRAYCEQVGEVADNIIGKYCYEISHKTSRPCYEEGEECVVRQVFATGRPDVTLHKHKDHDGHVLFVETKGYPIKDESGNVTSVIETINNITEKHLLEEERLKTQKLESIGTLAGGIAHDFNNLLQGIFGYISMAKMSLDQKERALAMLEQAENALRQSVSLTTQLLTFSRGGKPVRKQISLLPVIENAAMFALSGSRSECQLDIEPGLWQVDADGGQLGQVIQNIVLNADQAMPEGGTVVITARNVLGPDRDHLKLPKGKYVEISVQDNGIGIAGNYLKKIFDPYFTTKDKGSGLGLATSYSIIKNHGGVIEVTSELGKGTTFFIYLPAIEAEKGIKETPVISSSDRKGKILVMDDDDLILKIAGELVSALGHEVDFAEHGEAAIEKYQKAIDSGKPFDIVILDLTIRGGMGGKETLERLRTIDPGIRAVVSSGYSHNSVVADYHKYGFRERLTKPYRLEELRDVLNELLIE